MSEDIFVEKLSYFKQNEKPEVVLLVADNPEFIKIIVTWPILDIMWEEKAIGQPSNSEREIWDWLWKNTRFSLAELKEKADIPLADWVLEKKMKPLIGNHILYPDGTINSYVQRYLKERVVKLFEAKPKKPVKRA
jgi:hypothetical protein